MTCEVSSKVLRPLDEWNAERRGSFGQTPQGNGLACPSCGAELVDRDQNVLLLTCPPQIRVICLKCDFESARVA